ncbi:hypothetical protein D3C86_714390 [compost metagenome]
MGDLEQLAGAGKDEEAVGVDVDTHGGADARGEHAGLAERVDEVDLVARVVGAVDVTRGVRIEAAGAGNAGKGREDVGHGVAPEDRVAGIAADVEVALAVEGDGPGQAEARDELGGALGAQVDGEDVVAEGVGDVEAAVRAEGEPAGAVEREAGRSEGGGQLGQDGRLERGGGLDAVEAVRRAIGDVEGCKLGIAVDEVEGDAGGVGDRPRVVRGRERLEIAVEGDPDDPLLGSAAGHVQGAVRAEGQGLRAREALDIGGGLPCGRDAGDRPEGGVGRVEVGLASLRAHDAVAVHDGKLEGRVGGQELVSDLEADRAVDRALRHDDPQAGQVGKDREDGRGNPAGIRPEGNLVLRGSAREVDADQVELLADLLDARGQVLDREGNVRQAHLIEVLGVERDPADGIALLGEGVDHEAVGLLNQGDRHEGRVGKGEGVGELTLALAPPDGPEEGGGVDGLGGSVAQADHHRKRGGHRVDDDLAGGAGVGQGEPAAPAIARDGADPDGVGTDRVGGVGAPLQALDGLEVVKRSVDGLEAVGVLEDEAAVGIGVGGAHGPAGRDVDQRDRRAGSDVVRDRRLDRSGAEVRLAFGQHGIGAGGNVRPAGRSHGGNERARACRHQDD